jgi:hypothetical protein
VLYPDYYIKLLSIVILSSGECWCERGQGKKKREMSGLVSRWTNMSAAPSGPTTGYNTNYVPLASAQRNTIVGVESAGPGQSAPIHPLAYFFGPDNSGRWPRELDQHREHFSFPEAYKGDNIYLSGVLLNQITSSSAWWITEALPWTYNTKGLTIAWDYWIFDDHMLGRLPEETVPRLLTTKFAEGRTHMIRWGIGLQFEYGFWKTERGQMQFRYSMIQIANATIETLSQGAAIALLSNDVTKSVYSPAITSLNSRADLDAVVMDMCDSWAIVQKSEDGLRSAFGKLERRFVENNRRSGDYIVIPQGTGMYMSRTPIKNYYFLSGKQRGQDEKAALTGHVVRESRPFEMGVGREPFDPFFRQSTIGEYFRMGDDAIRNMPMEFFKTHMMDIRIHSEETDDWVTLSYADYVFHWCGLFQNTRDRNTKGYCGGGGTVDGDDDSGDSGERKRTIGSGDGDGGPKKKGPPNKYPLSEIGDRFFRRYRYWGEYLEAQGNLNKVATAIYTLGTSNAPAFKEYIDIFLPGITEKKSREPVTRRSDRRETGDGERERQERQRRREEEEDEATRERMATEQNRLLEAQRRDLAERRRQDEADGKARADEEVRRARQRERERERDEEDRRARDAATGERERESKEGSGGTSVSTGSGAPVDFTKDELKRAISAWKESAWDDSRMLLLNYLDIRKKDAGSAQLTNYEGALAFMFHGDNRFPMVEAEDTVADTVNTLVNRYLKVMGQLYPSGKSIPFTQVSMLLDQATSIQVTDTEAIKGIAYLREAGDRVLPILSLTTSTTTLVCNEEEKKLVEFMSGSSDTMKKIPANADWLAHILYYGRGKQNTIRGAIDGMRSASRMMSAIWDNIPDRIQVRSYLAVLLSNFTPQARATGKMTGDEAKARRIAEESESRDGDLGRKRVEAFDRVESSVSEFDQATYLANILRVLQPEMMRGLVRKYWSNPESKWSKEAFIYNVYLMELAVLEWSKDAKGGPLAISRMAHDVIEWVYQTGDKPSSGTYLGVPCAGDLSAIDRRSVRGFEEFEVKVKAKDIWSDESKTTMVIKNAEAYAEKFRDDRETRSSPKDNVYDIKNWSVENIRRTLGLIPISGDFMRWALDNNIPPLVGVVILRPHMTYRMGTMVYFSAYGQAGYTFYGHANMQLSDETKRKMIFGHWTLYAKSVILQHHLVHHLANAVCDRYEGGGGHLPWDPLDKNDVNDYRKGVYGTKALFACAVNLCSPTPHKFFDITGQHNPDVLANDSPGPHYDSANIYRMWWGWEHGPNPFTRPLAESDPLTPRYNTLVFEGHQWKWKHRGRGEGDMSTIVLCKSPWGPRVYPGCGAARTGRDPYLQPVKYADTATVAIIV